VNGGEERRRGEEGAGGRGGGSNSGGLLRLWGAVVGVGGRGVCGVRNND